MLIHTEYNKSATSRGLCCKVCCKGPWAVWVEFLHELHKLHESKRFLRGSTFYVDYNFYVGCLGQKYLCVGQNFLRGSKKIFRESKIRIGQFFFPVFVNFNFELRQSFRIALVYCFISSFIY